MDEPVPDILTRGQTSSRLNIAMGAVDKLLAARVLENPIRLEVVERLERRSYLVVEEGELTVLRTDARKRAYPGEDRPWIGFSTEHSNEELDATSLRWWRSYPRRVIDNELFVVTVATVPVAVYKIEDVESEQVRSGEDKPRFHYSGTLLHRVYPGLVDRALSPAVPVQYKDRVRQIMSSRIKVVSGGPIGYLNAGS
ncbi:hypothetical protein CH286_25255 [Rhodococcus sp. WWJCD1]|nr:hypothetical protein [Rhodococcus sp. WWJCD1]OZC42480.1 hypothetical protein CH286_25255 [Rhodococcus sp. WWJCD1]